MRAGGRRRRAVRLSGQSASNASYPSALGEGACERLAHRPGGREEDVLLAREVGRRSCASNNARACSLGDQCDARREPSSSKIDGSTSGRPRMEPLWSPVVATWASRSPWAMSAAITIRLRSLRLSSSSVQAFVADWIASSPNRSPTASPNQPGTSSLHGRASNLRFLLATFKTARFGPIGMEQLWNRGGATGGKRSALW